MCRLVCELDCPVRCSSVIDPNPASRKDRSSRERAPSAHEFHLRGPTRPQVPSQFAATALAASSSSSSCILIALRRPLLRYRNNPDSSPRRSEDACHSFTQATKGDDLARAARVFLRTALGPCLICQLLDCLSDQVLNLRKCRNEHRAETSRISAVFRSVIVSASVANAARAQRESLRSVSMTSVTPTGGSLSAHE